MIDLELHQSDDGEWLVWTQDESGAILGSGKTKKEAIRNAFKALDHACSRLYHMDLTKPEEEIEL